MREKAINLFAFGGLPLILVILVCCQVGERTA